MKTITYTRDLKGIKRTYEVKNLVELINKQDCSMLNEYTLVTSCGTSDWDRALCDAYFQIIFFTLKNGAFLRSKYYDGRDNDLERITWYFSDLFNLTIATTRRLLRSMAVDSNFSDKVSLYDRFGLNIFEVNA